MSLKISILILFLTALISFISYEIAKKKQNKRLLIITYTFITLFLIALVYLTLDLVIVGGIN